MPNRRLASHRVVCIEDLRQAAKRRLPRVVFDYIDGGAEGETTLGENCRAFDRIALRPKSAVAIPAVDIKTTILATPLDVPFILAPIGSSRLFYPHAEEHAARAAGSSGHGVYPVDVVGHEARGRQSGHTRSGVVSAVSGRRARRGHSCNHPSACGGLRGPRRHHRHAGRGHAGTRRAQRDEGIGRWKTWLDAAVSPAVRHQTALARGFPERWRPDEFSQRRARRQARDAVRRCRRGPRTIGRVVGRFQMDPRGLERSDRRERRPHSGGRSTGGRRRCEGDRRVEPRRPSARRRRRDDSRAARGGRGGRQSC